MKRIDLLALLLIGMISPFHATAETAATLTLDGLSFVSFQDEQMLSLAGSTIVFRFGQPQSDGSVPFTIAPSDVSVPEIGLSDGRTLQYGLASSSSGVMRPSLAGHMIEFNATVSATLVKGEERGTATYAVPFTTESASAASGAERVAVTGVRVVPGARYLQLVGATVNRPDAIPKPGTAVYTVLSGTFDRLP